VTALPEPSVQPLAAGRLALTIPADGLVLVTIPVSSNGNECARRPRTGSSLEPHVSRC
jgi:hypothetical protein